DMLYHHTLLGFFLRLHRLEDFPGTGIGVANFFWSGAGLGGGAWAEGAIDFGATFYFSLPKGKA
ncbi:MAG: two-component sensor histidine kinase, partial [Thiobacillus sp.]|nr:two-component sensor histidine kinase [Thiobacillus sp.]